MGGDAVCTLHQILNCLEALPDVSYDPCLRQSFMLSWMEDTATGILQLAAREAVQFSSGQGARQASAAAEMQYPDSESSKLLAHTDGAGGRPVWSE